MILAAEDRRTLLQIARGSVTARVTAAAAPPLDSTLTRLGGAFVTLRIAQALRGCIGRVTADRPLAETVQHVAAAAASEDPRFPPVRAEELGEVVIEVSVIGPLEVCGGPAEIEVGRHGVVVDDGLRRGLLLPQVAIEWGWDGHTFLTQTCVKAGLRPHAWKKGVQVFRFEAQVFGEGNEP